MTITLTEAAARQIGSHKPNVGNTCGCGESFSLKAGVGKGGAA